MTAYSFGVLIGFFIGLLIAVVLIFFCNRNKKFKTEYDERQKLIRGEAYKYGFTFLIIYMVFIMFFDIANVSPPLDMLSLMVSGILIGVTIVACYSIWNGAYWGLNNNVKRYMCVFIAGFILNGAIALISIIRGTMFSDGVANGSFVNFLVTIMFAIISIVMFVRNKIDNPVDEEN